MWVHNKESLDNLTPMQALEYLKEGNKRFLNNLKTNKNILKQVNQTSDQHFPFATILSCIDSRTSAELIFDQGLGDIFSIRIAGNILNDDILGSMEFACGISNSKIIVVLGHTKCGAIISACNNLKTGFLTGLLSKINPAIDLETSTLVNRNGQNQTFVNNVSINNVQLTITQIRKQSMILAELEKKGSIAIVGGIYDIENGTVSFNDN